MEQTPDWRANAIANIQAARVGKGRLGSRKVRTGCSTCRQRHLKCDEGRPVCQRCQDASRVCGYTNTSSPASPTPPTPTPQDNRLAFALSFSETQALQFFIEHVPGRLAGTTARFWQQELLQLCHHEPFVLDAVLCLSTLTRHPQFLQHFSSEDPGAMSRDAVLAQRKAGDPFGNVILNEATTLALRHFNRSIATLSQRLTHDIESRILAALSCLVYTAIDMSRDHVFEALQMYLQGRKIVTSNLGRLEEHALGKAVLAEFRRLDLFVVCVDLQPLPRLDVIAYDAKSFTSFEIARSSLASIMFASQEYVKSAARHVACVHHTSAVSQQALDPAASIELGIVPLASTDDSQPDNVVSLIRRFAGYDAALHIIRIDPMDFGWNRNFYHSDTNLAAQSISELIAAERHFANNLGQWYDAFLDFTTQPQNQSTSQAPQLLMYYLASTIWLATRLAADQTVFDKYDHLFREIIRHAKTYIGKSGEQQLGFTLELGAIPPLYFVATKCRIPSLRRQALRLLTKTPKKECTFGAIGCAEIAAAVARFEEADLGLPDPGYISDELAWAAVDGTLPAEGRRCHHFQVLQDDVNLRYSLLLSRYIPLLDGTRMQQEDIVKILPLKQQHEERGQDIYAYA